MRCVCCDYGSGGNGILPHSGTLLQSLAGAGGGLNVLGIFPQGTEGAFLPQICFREYVWNPAAEAGVFLGMG